MALETKTIRETNIAMEGIEGRLRILSKMIWAVIGFLGTLLIAAFALNSQLGDIKTDLAVLKSNVGVIGERLAKIEQNLPKIEESLRSMESKTLGSLSRIETRLAASPPEVKQPPKDDQIILTPLLLADDEIAFIRQALKAQQTGKPLLAKVGDQAADTDAQYLPDSIVRKIPRLKGYRYAYDPSGAILILAAGRVVQIIEAG
jgi:hypothetical protein